MDPRISARRTEVTRQQGRRRLRLVGIVVAVALVGFLGWCLLHSSLFSARAITVVGRHPRDGGADRGGGGPVHHPPLLDVQTGAEVKGIERLPWVRSASVSVHWPDGVRVVVSERVPTLVMADGRRAVGRAGCRRAGAGGRGRRARPGSSRSAGRKRPGAPGSVLGAPDQLGLRIAATLPASFRAQVTAVNVVSAGFVQLAMTTPILVDIGDGSQLHAKYEDVSAALAGATLHDGDIIDVSVPGAMTVTGP